MAMDEITRREFEEIERRLAEAGIPFTRSTGKLSGRPMYDFAPEHFGAADQVFCEVQMGRKLPADYAEKQRRRYADEQRAIWNGEV